MGKFGFEFDIFVDYIFVEIKKVECIFVDEMMLLMFVLGFGLVKMVWLWVYVRDDRFFGGSGLLMVVYCFEDSCVGDWVVWYLSGYCGIF